MVKTSNKKPCEQCICDLLKDPEIHINMDEEEKINTLNNSIVKALTTSQDKPSSAIRKDDRISEETREPMQESRNKRSEEATTKEKLREINRQIARAIGRDTKRYKVSETERIIENIKSAKVL